MEKVINYLIEELNQSERVAKRNAAKLCKYEDIKNEFIEWTKSNIFEETGISVDGYTAKKISELAPFMNGVGVYSFMVTLRDNPELAHETIKAGFPRK